MEKYQELYRELVSVNRQLVAIADKMQYGNCDKYAAFADAVKLENRREKILAEYKIH